MIGTKSMTRSLPSSTSESLHTTPPEAPARGGCFRGQPQVDALVDAGTRSPRLPLPDRSARRTVIALGMDSSYVALTRPSVSLYDFVQGLHAQRIPAVAWDAWPLSARSEPFSEQFTRVAGRAPQIHVNLDLCPDPQRFVRSFGTGGQFRDARFASPYRSITADELHRVFNDPNLLIKARFYCAGQGLSAAYVRVQPVDAARFSRATAALTSFEHARISPAYAADAAWSAPCLPTTAASVQAWAQKFGFRTVGRLCQEMTAGLQGSPAVAALALASLQPVVKSLRAEMVRAETLAADLLNGKLQDFYSESECDGRKRPASHAAPAISFTRVRS